MKLSAFFPFLLASASLSNGAIIIGNLAAYNMTDTGTTTGINYSPATTEPVAGASYGSKALSFVMGSTAFTVDSVVLRLTGVSNTGTDAPTISIYQANAGATAPSSTLIGTFTNPAFPSASSTNYTFAASGIITLAANTTYFLTVQQLNTGGGDMSFVWDNGGGTGNANTIPTGDGATNGIATFGGGPAVTSISSSSSRYNWYQLNGTAIPEPSSALLAIAGASLIFRRRAPRRARRGRSRNRPTLPLRRATRGIPPRPTAAPVCPCPVVP